MVVIVQPGVMSPGDAKYPAWTSNQLIGTIAGGDKTIAQSTVSSGRLNYAPFMVSESTTIDGLAFCNGSSINGAKCVMGLYASVGRDVSGGGLIVQTSEFTGGDTDVDTTRELTVSDTTLDPYTLYYCGHLCNGMNVHSITDSSKLQLQLTVGFTYTSYYQMGLGRLDLTYTATMPSTFTPSYNGISDIPVMALRVK
jgi:hypothetical protein|tara:strand:+ start:1001 stop:1591 length:591 start_codon:yes stop_codon:yes gene_type:complete